MHLALVMRCRECRFIKIVLELFGTTSSRGVISSRRVLEPVNSVGQLLTRDHGVRSIEGAVEDAVLIPGHECFGEVHHHQLVVQRNIGGNVRGGEIRLQ